MFKVLFFTILSIISLPCFSQQVGLSFGGTVFLGDLGGRRGIGRGFVKDLQITEINRALGISLGKKSGDYSFELHYLKSSLSGSDKIRNQGGAEIYRINRGLNFFTELNEVSFISQRVFTRNRLKPSISAGVGVMMFDPLTFFDKQWIRLRDLKTEGVSYYLVQPILLYGIGLYYNHSDKIAFQFDARARKLFTDYIDDVSNVYVIDDPIANRNNNEIGDQRGNSSNNDSYVTGTFTIIIKNLFRRDKFRCPPFK